MRGPSDGLGTAEPLNFTHGDDSLPRSGAAAVVERMGRVEGREIVDTHGGTQILSTSPLLVRTPAGAWEYALSFKPAVEPFAAHVASGLGFVTHLDVEVITGRIGVGWTTESGNMFIDERYLYTGHAQLRLAVPPGVCPGPLVFRNADRAEPSEFILHRVDAAAWASSEPLYQVRVASRDVEREPVPDNRGIGVFEDETARMINVARVAWLEAADLPVHGKRVIDVGCGVGHFASFYLERGCSVVGIDGRAENIEVLRARLPHVEGHVGDVQYTSLRALGDFDIVHCFGLLYHLDSPVAAMRRIADACDEMLILETMVCDSSRPVVALADESRSWNQALAGLGCRPSPAYVALALNRVGFPFVYGSTRAPDHPDFLFDFKNDLAVERDGHNLRCMFVASRRPVNSGALTSLLDQ